MARILSTLCIAALLTGLAPAWAEDQQTGTGADLPGGEPVTQDKVPGQAYIRETNGDWGMECLYVPEGQEEPCQMFQALLDDSGNTVANVRIFRLPEGGQAAAGALIAVPLETLLTAQLTLGIDEGITKRYPFTVCDRLGCYARIGFTNEDITAFKKGAVAKLGLVPYVAPDQRLQLSLSLKGFTASFGKTSIMQ
ncbi:MAG: invasion associated locus B family protein [Lutimaribacter sp.]